MARNDVFLNINSLSPADAVVTGQQDMTAATVPELVLGDTPTFNFYFTDNTNVWPSWAGNASYTLTWALSDAVSGDFSPAATTTNATPITGGWSVVLPLNAYDLVGLLNTKRVGQPYPVVNLWQQLRVADPSGNEITRAMFWTPVRYRAISDTQNTESASPTGGRFVTVNNVNALQSPTSAAFYGANPVPASALPLGLGTDTAPANGELLIGNGSGYVTSTLTAGEGITITNAAGAITIDASVAQGRLTATVKNAESTPITKGQVVYLFGATGNMPSVKLAYNTSDATSAKTFGVVETASISANGTGTVVCVGEITGLNLGAYQEGDTLYLGATPGTFTATKPYAPNHLVYVGIVEKANNGAGELYVKIQNGYELDEIHDVQILTPPAAGSVLIRDNTNSLWKAARLTAGTNIAITNGDASASIAFSGTLPVASGGTGVTTSTGSGSVVLSTSPSLTTPSLGAATATSINSTTIPTSKTLVVTTDKLSALAATSSSELAGVISDETGTGSLVFANTPTLVTPNIGAATGTSVNLSGAGTFGGNLTVSGGTATINGGASAINMLTFGGNASSDAARVRMQTGSTHYSWQIAAQQNINNGFEITPSTAVGGTTFSNPAFQIDATTGNTSVNYALNVGGNLTVSGTGVSSVAGDFSIGAGSASIFTGRIVGSGGTSFIALGTATGNVPAINGYTAGFAGTTNLSLQNYGGNLLLGTTTDNSNGKLQVAGAGYFAGNLQASRSDSTGVIRLIPTSGVSAGSDIESYNSSGSSWNYLNIRAGTFQAYTGASGSTLALSIDSSQRCILAGALRLNNAYTAGAPTATGYVTLQDSSGTTYKVLVST